MADCVPVLNAGMARTLVSGAPSLIGICLLSLVFAPGVASQSPTFEADIRPLLEKNCFSCHASGNPQAGLDLRSTVSMLNGGKSGPAIIAGFSDKSLLLEKIVSKAMPPTGAKLTEEEIELLRRWIDK